MASWKRYFNTPNPKVASNLSGGNNTAAPQYSNNALGLRDVYMGSSNRLERYNQYDVLDRDPVVNASLNIITEFCTQQNQFTKLPLNIVWNDETDENESSVLQETMHKWCYINSFRKRMYYMIRNTLKYGDTFYIRDPETYELIYVDPRNIEKVIVDEEHGKKVYSYFIRNVSPFLAGKIFTHDVRPNDGLVTATSNVARLPIQNTSSQYTQSLEIPAKHIVHLSLNSTGMDYVNWPFSESILETIYKPAKQKELLENAYLIYKIQRAPDRRVFYIDTGDMPSHKAMAFIERVKNDFQQKRIPSRNGGSQSVTDSTYDPNSINEDFWIGVNADGRGTRIESLPGGGDLSSGDGDLLDYFNKSVLTGLGIPVSYIPTIMNDSQQTFNDGKVGVALLQEWRFSQMCERLQGLLREPFDFEFKLFCRKLDITIMASDFSVEFEEPQSFSEYRQMEKDSTLLNNLSAASGVDWISRRFAAKKFAFWTEQDIAENEKLWKEENRNKVKGTVADMELTDAQDVSLNNVGVKKTSEDEAGIEEQLNDFE